MKNYIRKFKFENKEGTIKFNNILMDETIFKLYIKDKLNLKSIIISFPFYKRDLFKEAFYYIIKIEIYDDKNKNILPEPILVKGIPLTKLIRTPLMFQIELKYFKNILWFEKNGLNSVITPIEKLYTIKVTSYFAEKNGTKIGNITHNMEINIDNTNNQDLDVSKYDI